jgi:hypothetical protein
MYVKINCITSLNSLKNHGLFLLVNHVVFRIDFENKECGQGSSFLSDGPKHVDTSITEINFQTFLDVCFLFFILSIINSKFYIFNIKSVFSILIWLR